MDRGGASRASRRSPNGRDRGLVTGSLEIVLDAWRTGGTTTRDQATINAIVPLSPKSEPPTVYVYGVPQIPSTIPWLVQAVTWRTGSSARTASRPASPSRSTCSSDDSVRSSLAPARRSGHRQARHPGPDPDLCGQEGGHVVRDRRPDAGQGVPLAGDRQAQRPAILIATEDRHEAEDPPVVSTAALDPASLILNGRDAGKHYADLIQAVTQLRVTETITGASTLEITLSDPKRTLLQSKALTTKSTVALDRAGFELVKVSKQGTAVTLTFEDISVALLRRTPGTARPRPGHHHAPSFVRSLIREEPDIPVVVAPGAPTTLVEISRGSGSSTKSEQVREKKDKEDTWTAAGRIMGEIGWRVFARHGTVTIAPDSWLIAHSGKPYVLNPDTKGVHSIDFEWDTGKPAASASLEVDAEIHAILPGTPITLQGLGAGNGAWLVETIDRSLWNKRATITAIRPQPTCPSRRTSPTAASATSATATGTSTPSTSAKASTPTSISRRSRRSINDMAFTGKARGEVRPDRLRPARQAVRVRRAGTEGVGLRRLHVLVREAGRRQLPQPGVRARRPSAASRHHHHRRAGRVQPAAPSSGGARRWRQ
jgi:hypothetical protein